MTLDVIKEFLFWCVGINYAILIVWACVFLAAHDWLYRLHGRWFKLSPETFDGVMYGAMAVYKIGIMLFNLVPLAALYLTT
ncbi:DUF6868 family protein [Collimonas sp. NPDC087041]|uniref:DUF6868 family protein n=1 Tax=Collimonas sp. NPDC087041 TaxID=3363960 RepID=UPI0037FFE92C